MPSPAFPAFTRLARNAALVPVWREFLFDRETAVTAYTKLRRPPFGFLLESVVGGEKWARYTFLGTEPRAAWRIDSRQPGATMASVREWRPGVGWSEAMPSADPLAEFDRRLRAQRTADIPGLPRFFGGAVGYFGYDSVRHIERLPHPPPDDLQLPTALLLLTDTVLAIDNVFGRARAITMADVTDADSETELRARYDAAAERLESLVRRLDDQIAPPQLDLRPDAAPPQWTSSVTRERFEHDVDRVKEYIAAGDAFQVVLSQRLSVPFGGDPFALYRALRSLNPSPYMYFLELDGLALVGSSPEVLVRLEDGAVTVRPIAGTRPRGANDAEDALLADELLADEKERAEHLMLVDLGRNDIGRVARFGTVRVPEFMTIERYSHVLHIVSEVRAEARDGIGALDVFRACFPAGTVSGAPKIRAMEIIDELEPVRRGPYAGAVGYFAYGGNAMDTAITIRTIVVADGRAHVQAGAGVVADSVPANEYDETLAKARALLRVLAEAGPSSSAR
ncbi:MAG: anthranilate synthase component I [Longimicrobiales bacterium]